MKDQDWEKVQNDDYKLQSLIKDKYEYKRYTEKGKDPMSLIIAGKEVKRKAKEEEEFTEVNSRYF
jgi:hypothetical protein